MVGRSFHSSRSGWEALLAVREWSGGPPKGPEVAGRPSQRSGSCREPPREVWEWSGSFPQLREWLGGPPRGPGVVGWPFRMSRIGAEAHSEDRE